MPWWWSGAHRPERHVSVAKGYTSYNFASPLTPLCEECGLVRVCKCGDKEEERPSDP